MVGFYEHGINSSGPIKIRGISWPAEEIVTCQGRLPHGVSAVLCQPWEHNHTGHMFLRMEYHVA